MGREIGLVELLQRLASMVLVEALGSPYYRSGHLPGARNLPPDRVAELAPLLLPDRAAPIVVYGANASDDAAGIVARRLERLGYRDVALLAGGKQAWAEAGLPVDSEPE